jgi:hypothetical protein
MPAVNGVGEPCAGEPHARFDGRVLETERPGGDGPATCGVRPRGSEKPPAPSEPSPPRQRPTLLHHRLVRARGRTGAKRFVFLARWPSRRALEHARDRIRELTARSRLLVPLEEVVGSLNRFLQGWAGYFRIGNSARHFDKISRHAVSRVAIFVAKLHRRRVRYGWFVIRQTNGLGLVDLTGTVVAPRPNYAWRALMAEHRR